MKKFAVLAATLGLVVGAGARAEGIVVLNSEEASYSIIDVATRMEVQRLPIGREPHHLMMTPDGKDLLIASTGTNELLMLDARTGERRGMVRNIVDPYQLGFSPDGKWFVTAAYRLDHVDIYQADGFKLAGRIFLDGLPSHMSFDAESKTVFVTLQQSGRVAAFDLGDAVVAAVGEPDVSLLVGDRPLRPVDPAHRMQRGHAARRNRKYSRRIFGRRTFRVMAGKTKLATDRTPRRIFQSPVHRAKNFLKCPRQSPSRLSAAASRD